MQKVIDFINYLTDMDWQWYPFVFLRPEKHERMTTRFILKLIVWYMPILVGLSLIALLFMPMIYIGELVPPISTFLAALVYFTGFFFCGMRFIVAPAWNVRANQYHKQKRKLKHDLDAESAVNTDALPLAGDFANPTERTVPFVSNCRK